MITEKPETDYKVLKRKDLQKVLSYIIYFKYLYLQQMCVHKCVCKDDYIYIYIYAFSRRFYPKRLTIAFRLYNFISMLIIDDSYDSLTISFLCVRVFVSVSLLSIFHVFHCQLYIQVGLDIKSITT